MTTIVFDGKFLAADGMSTGSLPRRKHYELRDNAPGTHFFPNVEKGSKNILRDVLKISVTPGSVKPTLDAQGELEIIATAGGGNAVVVSAVSNFVAKTNGEVLGPLADAIRFSSSVTSGIANCRDATILFLVRRKSTDEVICKVYEWDDPKFDEVTASKITGNIIAIGSGAKAAALYHLLNPEATAWQCVEAACLVDNSSGLSLSRWPKIGANGEPLYKDRTVEIARDLKTIKQLKKPFYKGYVKRTRAIVVPKITLPTFDKEPQQ